MSRQRPLAVPTPVLSVLGALAVLGVLGALAVLGSGAAAQEPGGLGGFLAVRGEAVLASSGADRPLVPASVQKLIVTAAALHHLGPEHRVATRAYGELGSDGSVARLVVVGSGDPTWNPFHHDGDARAPLGELSRRLRRRGVRRVTDLVVDASAFPGRPVPVGWPVLDSVLGYGAAPTALALDRNTVEVRMAPGPRLGTAARLSGDPDVEWENRTTTVAAERHGKGNVDFQMVWGTPRVIVRGEFPISETGFRIEVAAPDPVMRVARGLRAALLAEGIEISGSIAVEESPGSSLPRPVPPSLVLAEILSPPLEDWLQPILAKSDNWYAENLMRVLAHQLEGEGRLDVGLEILERFLEEEVGADPASFALDDASGLSPFNLISPRVVVELLRWVWRQKWRAPFVASLANGRDDTLDRSWGATPPVAAKTGSLRHTQTLAGILHPQREEPIFFACFLNHRTEERVVLKREIVRQLWAWSSLPSR